ncbi:hypothetical protein NBH00_08825 [Paraconexibacter antarcticus]|uniref:Uncharacterized protein n=1 Tax=Paraconexibacter antarcticus TaxID=2949664 RepID=A0ABY5DXP8_9ACTN|nr:hypothetical protein [Paraconexibacter antarcticus]UTI66295.1 hypothetical protein NBH00_08825 [Paraconexibacter antarcticus]
MLRCPACERLYGGATMEVFGHCPLCLADHERFERLVFVDVTDRPARRPEAPRPVEPATRVAMPGPAPLAPVRRRGA